ncbi:hypothetical protein CDAR_7671 [Caerostris darwini]|uniref:Uncharacterized protein n=1 Tax=Caerostris darwini TaxID=1538125 RepID=A0AAV4RA96_9ARAC|nr:hypothetical protein CDAR_7671 [Caerostris darwini]
MKRNAPKPWMIRDSSPVCVIGREMRDFGRNARGEFPKLSGNPLGEEGVFRDLKVAVGERYILDTCTETSLLNLNVNKQMFHFGNECLLIGTTQIRN